MDFMKKYGIKGIEILCQEMTVEEEKALSYEDGMKIGIEQGIEQGEENLSALYKHLLEAGRQNDLQRAMEDRNYRKQLMAELGL